MVEPKFKYEGADGLSFELKIGDENTLEWVAARPVDRSLPMTFIIHVTLNKTSTHLSYKASLGQGNDCRSVVSRASKDGKSFNKPIRINVARVKSFEGCEHNLPLHFQCADRVGFINFAYEFKAPSMLHQSKS